MCNNRYYYRIGTPTLQSIHSSGSNKAESGPGLLGMGRVIIQDQGACAGWRTRAGEQMIGIERVPLDPLDHLLS